MNKYELLKDLISINTIDDLENNKFIEYVANYLNNKGFRIEYITDNNNKKCLIAKTKKDCELAFLGHSDTVPYSEEWITNPLELVVKDSKLFGLGVCDMKGGIAAFLESLNNIKPELLKKGLMVIISFDEEKSFKGINLIKNRKDIPKTVVVGEPTNLRPVVSAKGCMEYEFTFKGKSAHSSFMVLGENAILKTMNFINDLKSITDELKSQENEMFSTTYTTNNISVIKGGNSINIVPDKCKLSFDFRTVFEEHNDYIESKMDELSKKYNCSYKTINNIKPNNCNNKSKIKFFEEISKSKACGMNYVTEGNFFVNKDIIIIGPGPVTAHQENEFIEIESYQKAIEIYTKIIEKFCY